MMDVHKHDCDCHLCNPEIGEFSDYGRDRSYPRGWWIVPVVVIYGIIGFILLT